MASNYRPLVSWETFIDTPLPVSTEPYHYTCKVVSVNPNDYSPGILGIDQFYIVDYLGKIYQIKEIINVITGEVKIYDLLEDEYEGPYIDQNAYVYQAREGTNVLTQAQRKRLHPTAFDLIWNIENNIIQEKTFTGLTDSPNTYIDQAYTVPMVNADESALEFTSIRYTNDTPMPEDVGGSEAGTTFEDKTIQEMFTNILYPYQYPTFSAFSILGQTTILEVGDLILANRTFTWTTTNPDNVEVDSLIIRDVTGSTDIKTGVTDNSSEDTVYPAIQKTTATTNQFSITGTNSKSQTFNRTYTVSWRWRVYYGESLLTTLNEAGIEGLRASSLNLGFATTYSFIAGSYKYLCYPTALGTATSFKDEATGLNVPFESVYTVSVTNTYGVTTDYNVHRSTNIIGSAINIIVT